MCHVSSIISPYEIDDMNDDKIVHPSDDLADDMYNNIDYHNVQQEETINNSLYTLANNELQLSFDLEDPNKTDDWKSTNSHKGELVIAHKKLETIHYAQEYSMCCILN